MTPQKNDNDNELYLQISKENIDYFIYNKDYLKAFSLLIMVLEKLDEIQKAEIIDYYSKKINDMFEAFPNKNSQLLSKL